MEECNDLNFLGRDPENHAVRKSPQQGATQIRQNQGKLQRIGRDAAKQSVQIIRENCAEPEPPAIIPINGIEQFISRHLIE